MQMADIVFMVEFGAVFGAVFLFCFWQLRSLDKLDREEQEREQLQRGKEPAE